MEEYDLSNGANSDANSGAFESGCFETKINPFFIELVENWSELAEK